MKVCADGLPATCVACVRSLHADSAQKASVVLHLICVYVQTGTINAKDGLVAFGRELGVLASADRDGSVVSWGDPSNGGDSHTVREALAGGVQQILSTQRAFAGLKDAGSVITWGDPHYGGDCSAVQESLTDDVKKVYSNSRAFAAVRGDGSVHSWGDQNYGGGSNLFSTTQRTVSQL